MAVEPIFESYGNKLIGVPNNEESGGSGGHVIENSSGTDLPQEDTLQFADSHVTDDSTNGKTVVETFKAVTEAEYSSETEDGAYIITDGDGAVIGAVSEDYVLAEADGTKTWQQLLNSIWSDADKSKITDYAYIYIDDTILSIVYKGSGQCIFSLSDVSSQVPASSKIKLASYSTFEQYSSATYQNLTTNIASADVYLYYGNKKATVDLQTTANRCLMPDGTTVQDAINKKYVKAGQDGTKTWAELFNSLWTNENKAKLKDNSYIKIGGTVYNLLYLGTGQANFSSTYIYNGKPNIDAIILKTSNSKKEAYTDTYTDNSNLVATHDVYLYF